MSNEALTDSVGGLIYSGTQDDLDPYALAEQILALVSSEVRARCTPPSEAYGAGGDTLVYAVADWIAGADE